MYIIHFHRFIIIIIFCFYFFRSKKKFDWTKFRALSRLEKKFDDTLTEYYLAFSGMCKRVCGIKPTPEEGNDYGIFTVILSYCLFI